MQKEGNKQTNQKHQDWEEIYQETDNSCVLCAEATEVTFQFTKFSKLSLFRKHHI